MCFIYYMLYFHINLTNLHYSILLEILFVLDKLTNNETQLVTVDRGEKWGILQYWDSYSADEEFLRLSERRT